MVSGSDAHGTPITVRADTEGIPAREVYERFHNGFLDLFMQAGLTYDLFTSTHTRNHFGVSQNIFMALLQNGYLFTHRELQWYAPSQKRFLPDRYVEGTCYICGYTNARSDQCDKCGSLLEPEKLIDPRSKIDGYHPRTARDRALLSGPGQITTRSSGIPQRTRILLATECDAPIAGHH